MVQPTADNTIKPVTNPTLQAIPGETTAQYEARLSGINGGTGTNFKLNTPAGTPSPTPTIPSTSSANTPNGVDANGNPIKTSSQIQSEADSLAAAPIESSVPTRTSQSITDDFETKINALGAPPTVPDTNAEQSAAETQAGLPQIQSDIGNLTTQIQQAQSQALLEAGGEASKPGVVASVINGRISMISAKDAVAIKGLQDQLASRQKDLTNANTAVATIMKNNATDYTNAEKAYNDSYTQAYQLFTSQQSELSKEQASASANAKVIIDSFKGSTQQPTADQEAQWHNLELQAGLPPGFISAAVKAESSSGVKIDHWVTSGGETYAYGTDASGKPALLQAFSTPTDTKTVDGTLTQDQLNQNTQKMSAALQAAAGTDGMVSASTWNSALGDWIAQGGTAASFNSAFKSYKSTNPSASKS